MLGTLQSRAFRDPNTVVPSEAELLFRPRPLDVVKDSFGEGGVAVHT